MWYVVASHGRHKGPTTSQLWSTFFLTIVYRLPWNPVNTRSLYTVVKPSNLHTQRIPGDVEHKPRVLASRTPRQDDGHDFGMDRASLRDLMTSALPLARALTGDLWDAFAKHDEEIFYSLELFAALAIQCHGLSRSRGCLINRNTFAATTSLENNGL